MRTQLKRWGLGLVISLAVLGGTLAPAHALTRAGTPIDNVATVTYAGEELPEQRVSSPLSRVIVATSPGLSVGGRYDLNVFPGQQSVLAHLVENTGNTPLDLALAVSPAAWPWKLILDSNGNGRLDGSDETAPALLSMDVGAKASILAVAAVPEDAREGAADTLTLTAADASRGISRSTTDRLTVRSDAPNSIQLVADPATILGNGKDRSWLTATVLTARGTPVPDGTPVTFNTPRGTFEGGVVTITLPSDQGIARTYLTADIVSTVPVTTVVRVTSGTPITGVVEAQVEIYFSPAAVSGLVTDHAGQRPMPNLPARLLSPNGEVAGAMVTQEDGSYIMYVPSEGEYVIEVPVLNSVGDVVTIRQHVTVDRLGGANFHPEGAVVGVVADVNTRRPIANTVLEFTLESVVFGPSRGRAMAPGDKVRITTDERGGFVVNGLGLGKYRFSVTSADEEHYPFGYVDVDLRQAGEYVVNADILLDPFGYAYDSETGLRLPGAQVTLLLGATEQAASVQEGENPTRTAADGTYRFLVGPGSYRVRVAAVGYRTYESSLIELTRDVVNLNVPLDPLPTLSLEKRVDSANAVPGSVLQYTLTATNTGAGTGRGLSLVDVLPQGLTPIAESLGAGVYDPAARRVTWPLGDLARQGGQATITFQAQVAAVMPEDVTDVLNTAFLTSADIPEPGGPAPSDPNALGPVTASPVSVRVTAEARLSISKSVEQAQIGVGDVARFTIRFRNSGTAPARSLIVTDTLPDGLALRDGSRVATWNVDRLDPGAEETRVVEAVPDSSGLRPGSNSVTNHVTLRSPSGDLLEATADLSILVPYLRVTKRALVSEAEPGDVVPFEIVVENLSETDEARAVEVRDLLPAALHYRPGTSRNGGAPMADPDRSGGTCTWRLDRLAPKTALRLTFHTILAAGHGTANEVVNVAEATGVSPQGQPIAAQASKASIRRRTGFFSDRGLILGRLFVDRNGNRMPDPDEPGLANVAVITDSGIMAITDNEGKYVIPDIVPGEHVVRVDTITVPTGYTLLRIDSANAGTARSRFCRMQRGGLAKANFAFDGAGSLVGSARPGTALLVPPEEERR